MATVGTLLFVLIIAGIVAVVAIAVVGLLLGALAGLTSALAALVEWAQLQRLDQAGQNRRRSHWAKRRDGDAPPPDGPPI